ncbi:MAG: CrcB family protein [Cryobacterium sp.]|nr:CrcB family protein [Cryobacterium sp.]
MPRSEASPLALPTLLAVFVGGVAGTTLRLTFDALIPSGAFPFSTLAINTIGSFVLGVLVGRLWPVAPGWLHAGLGVGLLGTFTTFSAIMVSLVQFSVVQDWVVGGIYLVSTLVLGFAAAALGIRLGAPGSTPAIDEVTE